MSSYGLELVGFFLALWLLILPGVVGFRVVLDAISMGFEYLIDLIRGRWSRL